MIGGQADRLRGHAITSEQCNVVATDVVADLHKTFSVLCTRSTMRSVDLRHGKLHAPFRRINDVTQPSIYRALFFYSLPCSPLVDRR